MGLKMQDKMRFLGWALLSGALLAATAARADALDQDLANALLDGTPQLELRPRIEVTDPDNSKANGFGFTARAVAGYTTAPLDGFSAHAEVLAVIPLITSYNSQTNGKTGFATESDPSGINLGQGFLRYQNSLGIDVTAGRQIIALDDQRFFGKSDFRQNYQSIDSVLATLGPVEDVKITGGWGWAVKDSLNNIVPVRIVIGQGNFAPSPAFIVDAFSYFYANQSEILYTNPTDLDSLGVPSCGLKAPKKGAMEGCNNDITGGRVHGRIALGRDWAVTYKAAYAHQSPYDAGSHLVDADMEQTNADVIYRGIDLGAEYLRMGSNSNGTYGFQTPLSTRHLFNGWAEIFSTTPNNGLKTLAASLSVPVDKFTFYTKYFNFHSDYQDIHDGDEVDISVAYKFTRRLTGAIEYADYMAAHYSVHTNLAYAYLSYKY
jgi:hypothetical protein